MLRAAFYIGTTAAYTNSTFAWIKSRQIGEARNQKAEKDAERKAQLTEAVMAEIGSRPIAVSDQFARILRPGVLNRLGVTETKERCSRGWTARNRREPAVSS